jgi:hypothetical protein
MKRMRAVVYVALGVLLTVLSVVLFVAGMRQSLAAGATLDSLLAGGIWREGLWFLVLGDLCVFATGGLYLAFGVGWLGTNAVSDWSVRADLAALGVILVGFPLVLGVLAALHADTMGFILLLVPVFLSFLLGIVGFVLAVIGALRARRPTAP